MSYGVLWKDNHGNSDYYTSHEDLESAISIAEIELQYKDKAEDYEIVEVTVIDERNNLPVWKSTDPPELKAYLALDHEQWQSLTHGHHERSNEPSVYFDIDGTLGKWYSDGRGLSLEEMIDPANHYFRNIEPQDMVVALAKYLHEQGKDVCVISAAYKDTIRDKWDWVKEHLPFIPNENICFAPIGADKTNFVKGNAEISVLNDDYNKNLEEWKGVPVKALNGVNSHSDKFMEIDFHSIEKRYNDRLLQTELMVEENLVPESHVETVREQKVEALAFAIKEAAYMITEAMERKVEEMEKAEYHKILEEKYIGTTGNPQLRNENEQRVFAEVFEMSRNYKEAEGLVLYNAVDDYFCVNYKREPIPSLGEVLEVYDNIKEQERLAEKYGVKDVKSSEGYDNLQAIYEDIYQLSAEYKELDGLVDYNYVNYCYNNVSSLTRGELLVLYDVVKEQQSLDIQKPFEFKYKLLDRLRTDCDYYLGNGNHNDKDLWAENAAAQLEKMQNIYDELPVKPEWLTQEQIFKYAEDMGVEGFKEYKEYRDEWIKDYIDEKTLDLTSAFYEAAKQNGDISSSDTFFDCVSKFGFADSSCFVSYNEFLNSEYYEQEMDVYELAEAFEEKFEQHGGYDEYTRPEFAGDSSEETLENIEKLISSGNVAPLLTYLKEEMVTGVTVKEHDELSKLAMQIADFSSPAVKELANDIEQVMYERGEYDFPEDDKIRWIGETREETTLNIITALNGGNTEPLENYFKDQKAEMDKSDELYSRCDGFVSDIQNIDKAVKERENKKSKGAEMTE